MNDLPDLRAWLKSHSAETAELTLSHFEVKALHEELQRLHQSNERLRRQNRKVRGKVAKLKTGDAADVEGDDDVL